MDRRADHAVKSNEARTIKAPADVEEHGLVGLNHIDRQPATSGDQARPRTGQDPGFDLSAQAIGERSGSRSPVYRLFDLPPPLRDDVVPTSLRMCRGRVSAD